jgi:hypothetical protein
MKMLLLSWSKVFVVHLIFRDFQISQNLTDVAEESGRAAEVELAAGQRLRNNFDQTIFGHSAVMSLFKEIISNEICEQ